MKPSFFVGEIPYCLAYCSGVGGEREIGSIGLLREGSPLSGCLDHNRARTHYVQVRHYNHGRKFALLLDPMLENHHQILYNLEELLNAI